ncbi:MAG: TonB-dependent receptor, partial [Bacteroidota bacterium]|nr:TonB-dependent receptor [Bacteroidota bacterium]
FFTIDKRLADDKYGVSAIIGANRMDRKSWRNGGETTGGLVVPDLYNLNNSLVKASSYDTKTWKRVNSMYANATIDYNHFAYLELTARNDWSSTLPVNSRSYFYPSANLSLVLTELDAFKDLDYLSFAKIRGGYAQVGNDTSPYDYLDYYTQNATFMDSSLDQNPRMSLSSTKANDNLKPEKTSSWEIGTELKFFKNRLGIDLSYYKKVTTNQIVPVRVSGATGYGFMNINAGKMTNKGIEVSLTGTPIKQINGLQWDVTLNFATLNNTVNEIAPGLDYLSLGSAPFKAQSGAFKGMGYPVIYGTDFVYDDKGNKVVDADGMWLTSGVKPLANVTPKYTAGLTNSFSYKGFDLSILLDMQRGGHTYYTSYMWGMYSGLLAESAAINANGKNIREDIANGGGVLNNAVYGTIDANTGKVVYTDASGNVSAKPVKNTTYVDAQTWAEYHYDGPDAQNIFNTNFVKLREIRFGYTVPARYTGPVKGLRISAFGRDLATWGRASKHFDPEYLQMAGSNAQGIEGGYIPSTKTYGIGLNFNF